MFCGLASARMRSAVSPLRSRAALLRARTRTTVGG
nr:MAG TPA: hypothetical protein [Caudoviricetes sp.]